MKRLLFLFPLLISAQVTTIPNTTFPAVRSMMNGNFLWLNTNKAGNSACPANQYAIQTTTAGVVCANLTSGQLTTALGFTPENPANKGQNGGYLGIASDGSVAIGATVLTTNGVSNPKGIGLRTAGSRTVFMGDSITADSGGFTPGGNPYLGSGWVYQAVVLSKGRVQFLANVGVPGNTCGQMRARFAADVVAKSPDKVVILGCINSIGGGATLASMQADLVWMVETSLAANIQPILCTTPASDAQPIASVNGFNVIARSIARTYGLYVVDMYAATATTNGHYIAGYSGDGVHPNAIGAHAMASRFITDALAAYGASTAYSPVADPDGINLMSSGDALFAGGALGNWRNAGNAIAPTLTVENSSDGLIGKWLQVVQPADVATKYQYIDIPGLAPATGWAVGERIALTARIQISGMEASGGGKLHVTSQGENVVYAYASDVSDGLIYIESVIPVGTSYVRPQFQLFSGPSGAITLRIGQVGLVNLTRLGL